MPKPTVKASDPGRSVWWLFVPVGGAIIGAVLPVLAGAGGMVAMVGAFLGAAAGVVVAVVPPVKAWFSERAADHRVAELSGVGATVSMRSLDSFRVHASDRSIAEFAPRDVLPVVRNLLAAGSPVLVEGPSMAGKTRLVVQVLLEGWADTPLWFPADDGGISRLIGSGQDPRPGSVVFLDDIDRFLSNSSLSLTLLEKWLAANCVVVATMTAAKYAQWCDDAASKLPGWDVVNKLTRVHLAPRPTEGELAAMRSTGYADLVGKARDLGLPAILGGAPLAREKFRSGSENRSWGWALVRAAADWRRVGLGPATAEQLQHIATRYPDPPAVDQDWPSAWEWASKPFNHTVALLRAVGLERWEVLDVIADDATWPLSLDVLHGMADSGLAASQSLALGVRSYQEAGNELSPWVEALLDSAVASDDQVVQGRAALVLGAFLAEARRKPEKAGSLLKRALDHDPANPIALGVNAVFLKEVRKDYARAGEMYERALAADPSDANILGNFALFLTDVRQDFDRAGEMYERALAADPLDANILGNFALFLTDVRQDFDRAGEMYERALAADPLDASILGNFALFLTDVRQDFDRAGEMYERALAADPLDASILGNYAIHVMSVRQDHDRAEEMFERALAADPTQVNNLGNFAIFLASVRQDFDRAEEMHERALAADPADAIALGKYAIFLTNVRKDYARAGEMYERALAAGAVDAITVGRYARLLFILGRDQEGEMRADEALDRARDPSEMPLRAACCFCLFMHSPNRRETAGAELKALLSQGVSTGGWSFIDNLARAQREDEARIDLLIAVASALLAGDGAGLDSYPEWRALPVL